MIYLEPIGVVRNSRKEIGDDNWGGVISQIVINDPMNEDSLCGIDEFSHADVIFFFHKVDPNRIVTGACHPRNNPEWPKVGILAQRGKNRPNQLGLSIVKVLKREGNILTVENLDAIDGTPVLDIKPVMADFLPREDIRQPQWSIEIMDDYWKFSNR